jgi:hypothetical protein
LRAGYSAVPNIGGNYSLVVYVRNGSALYKYDPATNTLNLWDEGVPSFWDSPVEVWITLDTNRAADDFLGAEEAGCLVQNIYLEANTLGLGTVSIGAWTKSSFHHDALGLPSNEYILYDMPLGYPASSGADSYNFTYVNLPGSSSLPQIQQSSVLLEYALENRESSHDFSEIALTSQEVSQILWSAYGFSYLRDLSKGIQHRTVPSAMNSYPLTIYFANASGIYEYEPNNHSISMRVNGDKRTEIRDATDQSWVASAPASLIIVWDSTKLANKTWAYTEAGCVIQNVNLESVAEGLIVDYANVVNESSMSDTLGIGGSEQTNLHPVSVIVVGHPLLPDINNDGVVDILDAIMLSAAFLSTPNNPRWNPNADINHDGIVDIYDAIILAENFGKTT